MISWTWKQAVADCVLNIVNATRSLTFSLDDVYENEESFRQRFPTNHHVREKMRQTLQKLRDNGLVTFLGGGRYELNAEFADLQFEPPELDEVGIEIPRFSTVVRKIRLRNTLLASEIKRRYGFRCQVCHDTVPLVNRDYAEAHHMRPMGAPHFGRDIEGNILVVCPTHHVMLDFGAISIDVQTFDVHHVRGAFAPRRLLIAKWHKLSSSAIRYYMQHIYGQL